MSAAIKQMGLYGALSISAIQFNSVVFRCVVGVLANVPPATVALVTAIEFSLNFILEIPTGRLADKYGRIPCALVGLLTVILGLACGYTGLLLGGKGTLPELLYICHGIFIGFTAPLVSGSVDAFYQDAIKREEEQGLHQDSRHSFTLSKSVGKYFSSLSIVAAFITIYVLHQFNMAHHSFLIGIGLWGVVWYRLIIDYRSLGDHYSRPSSLSHIRNLFKNKRIIAATFYNTSTFISFAIIAGFFVIGIGREFENIIGEREKWFLMFIFFLSSQGIGSVFRGYLMPKLVKKTSTKSYISLCFALLLISNMAGLFIFKGLGFIGMCIFAALYGIIFFAFSTSIRLKSMNMLLEEFSQKDYAMAISVYNMPGMFLTGAYNFYIAQSSLGIPSIAESFITMVVISGLYLFFHTLLFKGGKSE